MMKTVLSLCLLLTSFSLGCSNSRRTFVETDLGTASDAGSDLGALPDSGSPADSAIVVDGGDSGGGPVAEMVPCDEVAVGVVVTASARSGFQPATVELSVGQSVRWTNADSFTHTVTAEGGAFNESLGLVSALCIRFNQVGVYDYSCSIHPSMTGVITVR